jgi:hypothetical protein
MALATTIFVIHTCGSRFLKLDIITSSKTATRGRESNATSVTHLGPLQPQTPKHLVTDFENIQSARLFYGGWNDIANRRKLIQLDDFIIQFEHRSSQSSETRRIEDWY